jgi:hypothetical protein
MLRPADIQPGDRIDMSLFGIPGSWEVASTGAAGEMMPFTMITPAGMKTLRLAADLEWAVHRLPRLCT